VPTGSRATCRAHEGKRRDRGREKSEPYKDISKNRHAISDYLIRPLDVNMRAIRNHAKWPKRTRFEGNPEVCPVDIPSSGNTFAGLKMRKLTDRAIPRRGGIT
jgi:hypothetical protein